MDEKELDDAQYQAEDQTFYRDSFGEKIIRDGEDKPTMADTDADEAMVPDEADDDMEPATQADVDDGFREQLSDETPKNKPASMDDDRDSEVDDLR